MGGGRLPPLCPAGKFTPESISSKMKGMAPIHSGQMNGISAEASRPTERLSGMPTRRKSANR